MSTALSPAGSALRARDAAEARYPRLTSIVDGRTVAGGAGTLPVLDPATRRQLGVLPLLPAADITRAVDVAADAFPAWAATGASDRAAILHRAAGLLRERTETIAELITLELGKPLDQARAEVVQAAGIVAWNAEEATRGYGRMLAPENGGRRWVQLEPVGPVLALSSWNAPLQTPARKMSSALAAGCTVVAKPAEQTPATALALLSALHDAGVPGGAAAVVFGQPETVSRAAIEHPATRAVTFTGSTAVGSRLAADAAARRLRLVLELGGHAPVVVLPGVDVPGVARGAVSATFRNAGQVCTSPSRFLVHQTIHDEFVEAFVATTRALRVGDGFGTVDVGPLAHPGRVQWMDRLVEDARTRRLDIPVGGRSLEGLFYAPTLIVDPDACALASSEEPFGPLATVTAIDDVEHALALANGLPAALAAYAFATDHRDVARLVDGLDCGALAVNGWRVSAPDSPFGGRRDSGHGVEGGVEGVASFRQQKFVAAW